MVNKDRHPTSPRLPVQTLPQACPPALGAFYCGMRVATAGLLGLCLPARRARGEMLRVGNKVSSFYGTQADRRGVERLGDCRRRCAGPRQKFRRYSPHSRRYFASKDGRMNHSSAGGRRNSGGLAMHAVMRVLIARWLAAIAMLGLLALVMLPVAYHACLTGCGLPYKCIAGENPRRGSAAWPPSSARCSDMSEIRGEAGFPTG